MKHIYVGIIKNGLVPSFNPPSIITLTKYYENGNKRWKVDYEDGQYHGKYVCWYKSGNKEYEADFINGLCHGKYIH